MKILAKVAASALLGSAVSLSVSAVPLTGSISMSTTPGSSWTGDGGTVNTIASILNFGVSQVDSATGDFFGATGLPVVWGQPLSFASPAVNNPLWTAGVFTFNISGAPLSVLRTDHAFPIPDVLELDGTGTLSAPGFDPTPGGWTWSGTMNGTATLTFATTTLPAPPPPPPVPDAGSTVALLGLALGGIGLCRRYVV